MIDAVIQAVTRQLLLIIIAALCAGAALGLGIHHLARWVFP